jgi:lipopolysaccharide transport system permease protein
MEYEIKPKGKLNLGLKELWEYRELFFFFTWRDIKVKYKQAVLGIAWVILQPIIMTFLFVYFFGSKFGGNADSSISIPYPVFVLSGLIMWTMFSGALNNAGNSMVSNANIIKKIYFPRLIIPISSVLTSLFDLVFGTIILIITLFFFGSNLNVSCLYLWPAAVLSACISAIGTGTFLAALNVKYRDFRYILPFLLQVMLFISPVIYPVSNSSGVFSYVLMINPVSAAIELFRGGIGSSPINAEVVAISLGSSMIFFVIGLFYFRKTEAYFADIA